MHKFYISLTVDEHSASFYRAELFLFSLYNLAKFPKARTVIVLGNNQVTPQFREFLEKNEYSNIISRSLLSEFAKDKSLINIYSDVIFIRPFEHEDIAQLCTIPERSNIHAYTGAIDFISKKNPDKNNSYSNIFAFRLNTECNFFGVVDIEKNMHERLKRIIINWNNFILENLKPVFWEQYRKNQIIKPVETHKTEKLRDAIKLYTSKLPRKLNIILHAGAPKTGTTSLQFFLKANSDALQKNGYLYTSCSTNTYAPKHQWLIKGLNTENENLLIDHFKEILERVDDSIHTIILSTEGIFNHWFDFTPESKSFLVVIHEFFNMRIDLWLRSPVSFIESYYVQNIKNPRTKRFGCYSHNISLENMMNIPWFHKHLDYVGFIWDVESIVGESNVKTYTYVPDKTLETFCIENNMNLTTKKNPKENIGLRSATVTLFRLVNTFRIPTAIRKIVVNSIRKYEKYLFPFSPKYSCSQKVKDQVERLFAFQKEPLKKFNHLKY